jgi:hypothetical protein
MRWAARRTWAAQDSRPAPTRQPAGRTWAAAEHWTAQKCRQEQKRPRPRPRVRSRQAARKAWAAPKLGVTRKRRLAQKCPWARPRQAERSTWAAPKLWATRKPRPAAGCQPAPEASRLGLPEPHLAIRRPRSRASATERPASAAWTDASQARDRPPWLGTRAEPVHATAQAGVPSRGAAAHRAALLVRGSPGRRPGLVGRQTSVPSRHGDGRSQVPPRRPLPGRLLPRIRPTLPLAGRPGGRAAVRRSGAHPAEAPHGGIVPGLGLRGWAAARAPCACRAPRAGPCTRVRSVRRAHRHPLARPDGCGGAVTELRRAVEPKTDQLPAHRPPPQPGPERALRLGPGTPRPPQRRDLPGGQRPRPARSRHLRRASGARGKLCRWPGRPASACPILLQRSAGRGLWPRPTQSR